MSESQKAKTESAYQRATLKHRLLAGLIDWAIIIWAAMILWVPGLIISSNTIGFGSIFGRKEIAFKRRATETELEKRRRLLAEAVKDSTIEEIGEYELERIYDAKSLRNLFLQRRTP